MSSFCIGFSNDTLLPKKIIRLRNLSAFVIIMAETGGECYVI